MNSGNASLHHIMGPVLLAIILWARLSFPSYYGPGSPRHHIMGPVGYPRHPIMGPVVLSILFWARFHARVYCTNVQPVD